MGVISSLVDVFRRGAGKLGSWLMRKSYGERMFSQMLGGWGFGIYPGSWTGNRIEQIQHYRHWVWRCIRTICDIATKEAPLVVDVRDKSESKAYYAKMMKWAMGLKQAGASAGRIASMVPPFPSRRFLTTWQHRKALHAVRPHEVMEHVPSDDELKSKMEHPNEWDTGTDLLSELIINLQLTGNAYLWPVPYKGARGIAEFWVMPSAWVWPQRTGKSNRLVDYYQIRPWGQTGSGKVFQFDCDELVHFRFKSPLSKIDGASPTQAGAEIVDSYEQMQLARFFSIQNGTTVGAVVELDAGTDPKTEELEKFRTKWMSRFQGVFNFNAPAILPPGAKLIRPDAGEWELAGIKSSDQLRDYICGMFGLTKSIVGFMEDANRAAFEAALAQCYFLVVNPLLSMIGLTFTEQIAQPMYGATKRVFWEDMTPADRSVELQEWNTLMQNAPYTGNEFRQWMHLDPIPEGEEVIVPMTKMGAGMDDFGGDDDIMKRIQAMAGVGNGDGNGDGDKPPGFSGFGKGWHNRLATTTLVNGDATTLLTLNGDGQTA
jgi:hypothetical protein